MKQNLYIRLTGFKITFILCACLLYGHSALAQTGTFNRIYTIFQNQCAACHGGAAPSGGLNLSGTPAEVRTNLVNVTPQNSAAAAKGQKLVKPGQPYQSFLLRKLSNGYIHEWDGGNLEAAEGSPMPFYNTPLEDREIEIVRQWILAGAPQNGTIAAETLVDQYFTDGGLQPMERPAPPPPDKGFQIHVGPIFVEGFDEKEYLLKYDPDFSGPIEIKRMEAFMNQGSHHFILYKFTSNSAANNAGSGLREVSLFGENPLLGNGTNLVCVWQYPEDFRLPAGTAYFWNENTIFDLNYHIPNYSADLILPSDVYINVYTQPSGTAQKEMFSDLLLFNSPAFFTIPSGVHTLEESIYNNQQWNIWMLNSHTHKYGTDFDIFRQSGGGPGEQLYEGWFDYNYCQCDVGYYDWAHPPVRYFEPMYNLPSGAGLYHRATYNNTSGSTVSVGLTTNNEMMITVIQYTTGNPIPYVHVAAQNTTYCSDAGEVQLELSPETGGVLDGPGIAGNVFVPALAGEGTHTITYTYSGITAEFEVTVAPPLASEPVQQTDATLSVAQGYDSYQWYLNGSPIADATGNTIQAQQSGAYTVTYTQNGCTGTSQTVQYIVSGVNTGTMPGNEALTVFPNPATDAIAVTYTLAAATPVLIELYDATGRLLQTPANYGVQQPGTYRQQLHLPDGTNTGGIYFVKLTIQNNIYAKKVVKY